MSLTFRKIKTRHFGNANNVGSVSGNNYIDDKEIVRGVCSFVRRANSYNNDNRLGHAI